MIILRSETTWVARWLDGNYAMYEKDRKLRLGIEADSPHRIKYRAMMK